MHQHSLKVGGAVSRSSWQGFVQGGERNNRKMSSSMRILDGVSGAPLVQTQFVQRYKGQRGGGEDQTGLPTVRHFDIHEDPIKEEDEDDLEDDLAKSVASDAIMSKKEDQAPRSQRGPRSLTRTAEDVHEDESNNEEFYSIKTAQNLMPEEERPQQQPIRAASQDQESEGRRATVIDYQQTTLVPAAAESFLEPVGVPIIGNTQEIENEPLIDAEDDEGASDDEEQRSEDSEGLINWEIDYGDQDSYSGVQFRTSVTLSGIHMMIIND